MMDLEPAQKSLLNFVRCKWKLYAVNPYGSNSCYCCKHGLKCVAACDDCIVFQNSCDSHALFCFYNRLAFIFTK